MVFYQSPSCSERGNKFPFQVMLSSVCDFAVCIVQLEIQTCLPKTLQDFVRPNQEENFDGGIDWVTQGMLYTDMT